MPVFQLNEHIIFPHPDLAEPNGLLAVGGDLSVPRLINAYKQGIFPWFAENDPILWWFTSPRMVLMPEEFKPSKRLLRYYRNTTFGMTINRTFEDVIRACAGTRRESEEGTWITETMVDAYIQLHHHGYAHSVECWADDRLVGGLYGIALGRVFFGESMFSTVSNSSKFALIHLVDFLKSKGYRLIDCQMTTEHLITLGARELSGKYFQHLLKEYIVSDYHNGAWPNEKNDSKRC